MPQRVPTGFAVAGRADRCGGFTLIELMLALAVVAILVALAVNEYGQYRERMRVDRARLDITELQVRIERYYGNHFALPDSLADIGGDLPTDPWGGAYYYTNLSTTKGKGKSRKDHKLNPLNSDYDLFSAGRNGVFKNQISQKDSVDDVIRARDGAFIDLASKF